MIDESRLWHYLKIDGSGIKNVMRMFRLKYLLLWFRVSSIERVVDLPYTNLKFEPRKTEI